MTNLPLLARRSQGEAVLIKDPIKASFTLKASARQVTLAWLGCWLCDHGWLIFAGLGVLVCRVIVTQSWNF